MVGRTGTKVRIRHLPHHDAQIEVFDAADPTRHLGTAHLADQATEEQRKALRTTREARARALKADLKAAEKLRRSRYTAVTIPAAPSVVTLKWLSVVCYTEVCTESLRL
jgi:putative transposase